MTHDSFKNWFATLTGHKSPRPWQDDLASESAFRSRLIRIPTGLGKTEGVLSVWAYHRLHRDDVSWPRRLVWCLPMRVLVEQTEAVAKKLLEQVVKRVPPQDRAEVYVAMGGEDTGEWFLHPEKPAIIIGTQDMLLSRALNRGFASGRARWPSEFGLLNHDTLWVMDEVQLMDVGLATSAQLQAFRDQDAVKHFRPCHTWWMSATLQPDWLRGVDTARHHKEWIHDPCLVAPDQRTGGLWEVCKSLNSEVIDPDAHRRFAQRILAEHAVVPDGDFGRITLVVCNTVDRASETFDALREEGRAEGLELVHSRFRPYERDGWRERFLSRSACTRSADRIIVATQVVEAGVDLSAGCLITELAPWPSLVQRFGRCARYGGSGKVVVVDRRSDEDDAKPYESSELEGSWETVKQLQDVGIAALEAHEASLKQEARSRLYPYSPTHLLLRREFDELFDTTPDLTGADLDISRFIRSGEERDLQVFWLNLAKGEKPNAEQQPHRRELCSVPFLKARDWLCGEETKTNRKPKLRGGMRAWVWDWIDGEWVAANRAILLPGRVVCVAAACGGYRPDRGFDLNSPVLVPIPPVEPLSATETAVEEADDQEESEALSQISEWKTIGCHSHEVSGEARKIAGELRLSKELQDVLELAALWHDWGKSHPAFQGAIHGGGRPDRCDLAKGPKSAWRRPPNMYRLNEQETRPGFRHELASSLGLFAILQTYAPNHPALLGPWSEVLSKLGKSPVSCEPQPAPSPLIRRLLGCSPEVFDLVAYLVASHHGKVRVGLHAAPKDQEYRDRDGRGLPIRGVRDGDRLPAVVLVPGEPPVPEVALTLSPAAVGLSGRTGVSWRERCTGLTERHGPAALAFLEAVLRAADVRASRLKTNDPTLAGENNP